MMINLLVDVAETLESVTPIVSVTPGEPPAPTCSGPRAFVWGNTIYHAAIPNQRSSDEAGCFYRRAYEIAYRIDVCYPITTDDLDTAELLAVASELYDLADEAWCALTSAASAGTLFQTIGECEAVTVGALEISEPLGGIVSATGTLTVSDPCVAGS